MIIFPFRRRMLLAVAFLSFVLTCSRSGGTETLKSHECFQDFSAALAQVKENIPKRFGQDWKMESLPPEIAQELEWITKAAGELQNKNEKLDSRAWSLHMDESALESAAKWVKTRSDTLDDKQKDFDRRWEAFVKEVTAHEEFVRTHNANQCKAPEDNYASVCGAYDEEARRGNEERTRLEQRKTALVREEGELGKQREGLLSEASQLASRSNVLDQTRASMETDVSGYMESCGDSTQRARALVEILANRPAVEHVPGKKADANEEVLKSFGQETVVQSYEHFLGPLLKGAGFTGVKLAVREGPGIALLALDVGNAGMDERDRQVTNNTFLLGEYAMALKRLQKQGTIRAGEPGYEALRQMQEKLVKDAPASPAEFAWQTLSSRKVLVDGVAAAVGKYVSTKTEHLGAAIMKHLTPEEKQTLGRKGVAFFKPVLSRLISGGSGLTTEAFLKDVHEEIHQQRQKWTERKVKTP